MKKRRIVIISFVLVAVLAIGVGFAAVADTLLIQGNFNFRNATEILGSKDAAIKFTGDVTTIPEQTATEGAVSITANASDDTASMHVSVNGITVEDGDTVTPYVAVAVYDVKYDTTDTTLDPVHLSVSVSETSVAGLEITAEPSTTVLSQGQTMQVTVTVTYTPTVDANNNGSEITETFEIRLEYSDRATETTSN